MLLKNNKINKLKDRIKLFTISLAIICIFLLIIYIQLLTKKDYFLDIVFVILGSTLFSYYSFLSISNFMKKYKKIVIIGTVVNTLIIGFYLIILFLFKLTFNLGLFFHGLILIAELFIFKIIMINIIKKIKRRTVSFFFKGKKSTNIN